MKSVWVSATDELVGELRLSNRSKIKPGDVNVQVNFYKAGCNKLQERLDQFSKGGQIKVRKTRPR